MTLIRRGRGNIWVSNCVLNTKKWGRVWVCSWRSINDVDTLKCINTFAIYGLEPMAFNYVKWISKLVLSLFCWPEISWHVWSKEHYCERTFEVILPVSFSLAFIMTSNVSNSGGNGCSDYNAQHAFNVKSAFVLVLL